ncbi:MAG: hypothetical protein VB075_10080 [Petrimonas sp.]|uniref:hypothetical protein n=1 Tax=Petrimonas sp. TaxID=2023866 RepID=UPI002B374FE8|nr:hypothetical protein [Petrimonas sp.]
MRKITKKGIDVLRNEFPVLTNLMMRDVVGGNKCLGEAIYVAFDMMGMNMSQDAVDNQIVDYLVDKGIYPDRRTAFDAYNSNGVNASHAGGIIESFIEGITCGSGQTNTEDIRIVYFALDNDGNAHAGIYQGDVTINGELYFRVKDKNGTTWNIPYVENNSNILGVGFIPKACDDEGSGSGGGSGSGSGSGSGNYCGSGSGWY